MPDSTYRDLTTLEDFAAVVELEREIWGPGYDEVVPVPILAVSVHARRDSDRRHSTRRSR